MDEKTHAIPPAIWTRLVDFITGGRTGQFTMTVERGRIKRADVTERITTEIRADDERKEPT